MLYIKRKYDKRLLNVFWWITDLDLAKTQYQIYLQEESELSPWFLAHYS